MTTTKEITKNEFAGYCHRRGFEARYSGKLKKFFVTKTGRLKNIHKIISEREANPIARTKPIQYYIDRHSN